MERIFVQIPSYRDPELQPTLEDLFATAEHPERLSVGLCLQIDPKTDHRCDFNIAQNDQIRCLRVSAPESRGVCWARNLIQTLWSGEEFTLQIDSHTRFERGWDRTMVEMLRKCRSSKPILSTYPSQYDPSDIRHERDVRVIKPSYFDKWGTLLLDSMAIPADNGLAEPIRGALCGAGFLFGSSRVILEVPYDPYVYFFGEEISLSVRLWTHGWDVFHPHLPLLYHYWERDYRPTHWNDIENWSVLDLKSRRRVNHMLGIERADGDAIEELERYGLGTVRSLAEYEAFSGIDFEKRSISGYRLLPDGLKAKDEPLTPFRW